MLFGRWRGTRIPWFRVGERPLQAVRRRGVRRVFRRNTVIRPPPLVKPKTTTSGGTSVATPTRYGSGACQVCDTCGVSVDRWPFRVDGVWRAVPTGLIHTVVVAAIGCLKMRRYACIGHRIGVSVADPVAGRIRRPPDGRYMRGAGCGASDRSWGHSQGGGSWLAERESEACSRARARPVVGRLGRRVSLPARPPRPPRT